MPFLGGCLPNAQCGDRDPFRSTLCSSERTEAPNTLFLPAARLREKHVPLTSAAWKPGFSVNFKKTHGSSLDLAASVPGQRLLFRACCFHTGRQALGYLSACCFVTKPQFQIATGEFWDKAGRHPEEILSLLF